VYLPARQTIHLGFIWECIHTLKMLGCFDPNLDQMWTNPKVVLKM